VNASGAPRGVYRLAKHVAAHEAGEAPRRDETEESVLGRNAKRLAGAKR
jgi:hypothetical protein